MRQWLYLFSVWATWLGLATSVLAQATVEGTVQLPKSTEAVIPNQRYPINTTKGILPASPPEAVVYLDGAFPKSAEAKPPAAQLAQNNQQFVPVLLPVQVGSMVEFPNQDEIYHNVFSYSKAKRFDLGRYRKNEKPAALVFDKPGAVKVYCEIHEHMRATVLVLETPYFTKTDAEGKFILKNLPTGKHTLKAWIDEKTIWERPVELREEAVLRVDFPGK